MGLSGSSDDSRPGSLAPGDPHELCVRALPEEELIAWVAATAGELRAYHYGGPAAKFPLKTAFAGASDDLPGAWCGVQESGGQMSWYVVASGQQAVLMQRGATPEHGLLTTHPQWP